MAGPEISGANSLAGRERLGKLGWSAFGTALPHKLESEAVPQSISLRRARSDRMNRLVTSLRPALGRGISSATLGAQPGARRAPQMAIAQSRGLNDTAYQTFFKSNVRYVTFIVAGAVALEVVYGSVTDMVWENINRGVRMPPHAPAPPRVPAPRAAPPTLPVTDRVLFPTARAFTTTETVPSRRLDAVQVR